MAVSFSGFATSREWPELDLTVLEERRATLPAWPVEFLAEPWRRWLLDTALSRGAPVDYVAQSLLSAVAALAGAGVCVKATEGWREPMILWQALVGAPSAGKSRGMAALRRLLRRLEGDHAQIAGRLVVDSADLKSVVERLEERNRGLAVWRDVSPGWLPSRGSVEDRTCWLRAWSADTVDLPSAANGLPLSILTTVQPEALAVFAAGAESALTSRFLYAWPNLEPYRALAPDVVADDGWAGRALGRLSHLAWPREAPLEVAIEPDSFEVLDGGLARMHGLRAGSEGAEAAWIGKGPATALRLALALELLDWMAVAATDRPAGVRRATVEKALRLWSDYLHPHARAVFDQALPTDHQRRVRRAARWLRESGAPVVSREDIRRRALAQTADSMQAQSVLLSLQGLGFLREVTASDRPAHRPARRWEVNPLLRGETA